MKLFHNADGARANARAVLAYLSGFDGLEASWDDQEGRYLAEPTIERWKNHREQGYVVSLRDRRGRRQDNIAFFNDRNTGCLCAVEWEQVTSGAPTLQTMNRNGAFFRDRAHVSFTAGEGEASVMADRIMERLEAFWTKTSVSKPKKVLQAA